MFIEHLVLCDNLEGWDGGGEGGSRGGDICMLMADSHCCTAQTNKTLYRNYPPIKNKF